MDTADNKLIAEFIAGEEVETHHNMYKHSWSELMAAVNKIEYLYNHFDDGKIHDFILNNPEYAITISGYGRFLILTNIEEVYQSVVEFVKWFNENRN